MKTVYILGRQSDIGVAEIESIIGSQNIRKVNNYALVSNFEHDYFPFSRLGGSIKAAKILTTLPTTNWNEIEKYIYQTSHQAIDYLSSDNKIKLGVSLYGFRLSPSKINASALGLKKILKSQGFSVRIVPNKSAELSSAQVIHNKLCGSPNGYELLVINDNNKQTILALTTDIQDIDAYSARDQKRPMRDAKVGMLPPKLAQTIINIASTGNNRFGAIVLDPFCGTGVILQEALIMGFKAYGTDIEPRMIEYTDKNLQWLKDVIIKKEVTYVSEVGDATKHKWLNTFDFVAAETYLGRPLSSIPDQSTLSKIINDCDTIHKKFLSNLATQIPSGTRICLAVPAWITKKGILHLKTLDYLQDLGYTRQSFVHANNKQLVYYREGQNVGRELVVLIRK